MKDPEKNSVSYSKTSNTTHWMCYSVPFRRVGGLYASGPVIIDDRVVTVYKRASATNSKSLALLWSNKMQQRTAY